MVCLTRQDSQAQCSPRDKAPRPHLEDGEAEARVALGGLLGLWLFQPHPCPPWPCLQGAPSCLCSRAALVPAVLGLAREEAPWARGVTPFLLPGLIFLVVKEKTGLVKGWGAVDAGALRTRDQGKHRIGTLWRVLGPPNLRVLDPHKAFPRAYCVSLTVQAR